MFCKNCGANIPDTAKFCKECGTPVVAEPEAQAAEPVVEAPVETPVEAPAEVTAEAPVAVPAEAPVEAASEEAAPAPKKKSKAKPVIITIAVIVAVLGTLAGLLIGLRDTYRQWGGPFPYIANTVDKLFLSEKEYSEKVAKNAVEGGIESLKDSINEVTNPQSTEKKQINLQDLGLTSKTKIEVDESLLTLLQSAAGVDLSFLKSVEIVADVDSASNAAKVALEAKLNDKSIAKLSAIADYENTKAIYLTLPDLSESAVKLTIPEEAIAEISASAEEMKKYAEAIDIDAASNLIVKVLEVAMNQIDDYKTEDEKLTVEGVSVNSTKVVITIDEKVIKDVLGAVLEELEANEDLKKVMKGVYEISGEEGNFDEIWDQMKESISQTKEMLKETDLSEMNLGFDMNINLWVDGKGEIIGMGADVDAEGTKAEFRAVSVVDGNDEAMEVIFKVDLPEEDDSRAAEDEESLAAAADTANIVSMINEISIIGKGTRTDGKLTGEYALKVGGQSFVDFALENYSEAGGTVTIKLGKGAKELIPAEVSKYLSDGAIKIKTEATDTTSKVAMEVIYAKASLVKFSSEITLRDLNKDFSVKADKTYNIEDEEDLMKFLETIDVEKLMENVEKAGVPVDELMSLIGDLEDLNFGMAEEDSVVAAPNFDYNYDYYDEEEAKQQASENVEYYDYVA